MPHLAAGDVSRTIRRVRWQVERKVLLRIERTNGHAYTPQIADWVHENHAEERRLLRGLFLLSVAPARRGGYGG